MTALFGIPLLVGFLFMLAWIAATAVAATVDGWQGVDPERRFGKAGRFSLAALIGFGMAGISSLYGGWPLALTVVAGGGGAVGLVAVSIWLGPEPGD
ncbi:MAG: hypothetical protein QGM46_01730 [Actinomycetota bacterium]|nr:hypothetical protein [Actinomycetota bacterium]MDK1016782.1 hypothetical protein [Actinomycetota bacterium]MDK1037973.1 hypothetical protein [Actinomycetota bacterium]MDK1096057.1 hypothetical protein [Actinomycetota bacterium]MDK1102660.1 hypothetical protein [Actinomycetota bacterium]